MIDDLNKLRTEVDKLDKEIVGLLDKRFEYSREAGKIKRKNNIKITNKCREKEVLANMIKNSKSNSRFIRKFWKNLMRESRRVQNAN